MYTYAPLQLATLPTIEEAKTAIRLADLEDNAKRDPRPMMAILMRMRQISPRLRGHILTRRTAVSAYSWKLSEAGGNEQVAADTQKILSKVIDSVIKYHTDTPLTGAMCLEVNWQVDLAAGAMPAVSKHFSPVEFERYAENSIALLTTDGPNLKRTIVEQGADRKYIIDLDEEAERGGILRSLVIHEILRNESIMEWSNVNRLLKGIVSGIIDYKALMESGMTREQIKEQIDSLDEALTKAGQNNTLKSVSAIDIQLKQIADSSAGKSFSEFKTMLENDIAIAVLGQANTAELPAGGGSRAALQVLNMIRADIHFWDMLRVENIINTQVLPFYAQMNTGAGAVSPFTFEWIYDDVQDIESNARMFETVARLGVDVNISREQFYRMLNLAEPEPDEEVMNLKGNANAVF